MAAPPVNFPSPSEQAGASASAGFSAAPQGPTLCGFGIPGFQFNVSFRLPGFPPYSFPPKFAFFLGLNCDLSDPIDAHFAYGGGRVPNVGPSDDEDT